MACDYEGSLYYRYAGKDKTGVPYITITKNKARKRFPVTDADDALIRRYMLKTYARHIRHRVKANLTAMCAAEKYTPFDTKFIMFGGAGFSEARNHFFGEYAESPEFDALPERQNPSHPEHLNVKTELGVFRSREEYIVARALNALGLKFKYEAPLVTPFGTRFPDFAVPHPKSGKIIYLDYGSNYQNPGYQQSVWTRMRDYMSAGVYPGVNLFYIAASPDGGIDQAAIMSLLKGIFEL